MKCVATENYSLNISSVPPCIKEIKATVTKSDKVKATGQFVLVDKIDLTFVPEPGYSLSQLTASIVASSKYNRAKYNGTYYPVILEGDSVNIQVVWTNSSSSGTVNFTVKVDSAGQSKIKAN